MINSKQRSFGHWIFGNCILFVIWCLMLGALSGCASLKEAAKGVAGVSTKALEEARKDAITANFNLDYFSCFTKASDTLKESGAYIYASDIKKHMIAFYVSAQDTTPAGFFFQEIDANNTGVEVSSPSTYAKELFAQKLSNALNPKK